VQVVANRVPEEGYDLALPRFGGRCSAGLHFNLIWFLPNSLD
jgi:hypothetical protein